MTRSTTLRSAPKPVIKAIYRSRFLIVGYGNKLRCDEAIGPVVADTVAKWKLPSTKAISVHQLTKELASDIADTDYVIFASACTDASCARTVQLDPIELSSQMFQTLAAKDSQKCSPLSLLGLAQQISGRKPQAWFLQIPIDNAEEGKELSSIAKRGCDQAMRTIENFLRTYQQPIWMSQEPSRKLA